MVEQLGNIAQIYDLLALCSSYIVNEVKKTPYEFSMFEDSDYDCVYDAIERYCCECRQKGRRAAFDELRGYMLSFFVNDVTIEKCFAVVKYIDELVEVEIKDKLLGGRHIIKYASLNGQYKNCIRIIPRMKGTFLQRGDIQFKKENKSADSLFRDRRACTCSVLDGETLNYMVWDKEHIERFPVQIYRFGEKSLVYKHFSGRGRISFGVAPFSDKPLEEILEVKYIRKAFYIEKMYEEAEQELIGRYADLCGRCKQADIDFLIFPEMLMTEKIISSIQDREEAGPQIIINGSIWKDYVNKSIITDGKGREICTYSKKEPFKFKKGEEEYKEYLDPKKNREYSILEIEGIGRIGIGICKDLINEEVKLFHKSIGTDILLVPAYTKSMDIQASAEGLSQEYNCVVVVANACAALKGKKRSDKKIGFVTFPSKNETERSKIVKGYFQDHCSGQCTDKCTGKKFLIDFYHTREDQEGISFEICEDIF